MKKSIVLATAVASVLSSGVAVAELSANAAVTSNYIWRGISQTNDQAAGQGGIDWGSDSGLYAGTWVSNVAFGNEAGGGYEMDVYAGFAGEAGGLGYDLGVITYQYPVAPNTNFTEVYASGTFSMVTVGVAYTVDAASGNADLPFDSGDMYVNGSIDFTAGKSDVSVYAGTYMFDADGNPTKAAIGFARGNIAERTSPRADLTHDHHGGVTLAPAFAHIRTTRLFAHGHQIVLAHDLPGLPIPL